MDSTSADQITRSRRRPAGQLVRRLIAAIRDNDERQVEEAVLQLARTRKIFAPLALAVGAFVMLFNGLRLLVTNWRLMLIQALPAMWIWLATLDLKAHVLHGKEFNIIRGPIVLVLFAAVVLITIAAFYLNATFAFAISQPSPHRGASIVATASPRPMPVPQAATVLTCPRAWRKPARRSGGPGWEMAKAKVALR